VDILGALARAAQSAGGEGAAAGGWNGQKLEGKSAVGRDLNSWRIPICLVRATAPYQLRPDGAAGLDQGLHTQCERYFLTPLCGHVWCWRSTLWRGALKTGPPQGVDWKGLRCLALRLLPCPKRRAVPCQTRNRLPPKACVVSQRRCAPLRQQSKPRAVTPQCVRACVRTSMPFLNWNLLLGRSTVAFGPNMYMYASAFCLRPSAQTTPAATAIAAISTRYCCSPRLAQTEIALSSWRDSRTCVQSERRPARLRATTNDLPQSCVDTAVFTT
jgi:hypothetical protein